MSASPPDFPSEPGGTRVNAPGAASTPDSGPGAAPPLVLASASPRRADLLTMLGLSFDRLPADVPEFAAQGEAPASYVERLSREKARAVAARRPDALVLAGDTIVVLDGEILEKPVDEADAVVMLLRLAGRTHTVFSGLALASPGRGVESAVESTQVTFRSFDRATAEAYVATGEPMDKAGAYGIQGRGAALVQSITGDFFTVVGLPVVRTVELLERSGWRYRFGQIVRAATAEPG